MNEKEICENNDSKIVPVYDVNNVPLQEDTHISLGRKYVTKKQLSDLAEIKGSTGITLYDIQKSFGLRKKDAQRRLKYFHELKVIFTAQDLIDEGIELPLTFKNRSPQRYYASTKRASIIEKIKKDYRIGLLETTGISKSSGPLVPVLEHQKANSFLDVFNLLPFSSIYIHKINLLTSISKDNYEETSKMLGSLLGKKIERIGKKIVKYIYHPNGSVQVFVECSRYPLKLETDEDINIFFSLMGQIRDRMIYHISDTSESIVPSVNNWILKQCDINNDIPITDKAQTYLPDIQLKIAGKVFRMYVKSLGDKAVCRFEDSKETNTPLSSFNQLFGSTGYLEEKIQNLAVKVENLSLGLNSLKHFPIPHYMPSAF